MQRQDELTFTMLMARNVLLVRDHLNTKSRRRFVAAVRVVAVQASPIMILSDFSDNLSF